MNIGRQWADRLRIWAEQFSKHYFTPHSAISLEYFPTMERLSPEAAQTRGFAPAPAGTRWGRKWEYGWFRGEVTIPPELAGKRVVFTLNTAPEMLVWVNGAEAGAIGKQHKFITLSRCARAGEKYAILAEGYAGHGVRNEGAGPVAPGEEPVPEPPQAQVCTGESVFGVWNEDVFQAAMDYLTLFSLLKKLPEKSLRAMKILEGLKKFTYIADFELPEPEMTASVAEAAKILKPLLSCRNGSTAPDYTVFGQSHLDLAWLWPVEETRRKAARTYSNQLALMEEYPDYRFLLCEPPILEYLKQDYPRLWKRVREKVQSGAFYPEGALWVESDTNIPSGESLIRQFVRGKRWFRRELGVESILAWMPDTFGFSPVLPQIMKKCGVPYFATQKLTRQDPEAEPFPYNVFWWEGLDGSRVLAHLFKKNNAVFRPEDLITRWEEDRVQQEGISGLMFPFGYGDGGGGPTREMAETLQRCADLEGAPRCHTEHPTEFFRRALAEGVENVYRGELYLAWHRGTYTAQARTKRGIRRAETALKLAEYHLARLLYAGKPLKPEWQEKLDALWELLLFNQFHDIAPGSSIARVHAQAEAELAQVERDCGELLRQFLGEPSGTAAYNHLGWPRTYRGTLIPAQGSAILDGSPQENGATVEYLPEENCYELKNAHLICRVNPSGELTGLRIAGENREYLAGTGNRFLMYKDVNTCYDAWELGSMYEQLPVALEPDARIHIEETPDGAALVVERKLHDSPMTQRIFLGSDARRLDFVTTVHWRERHKLLKVSFPANVHTDTAITETQFGFLRRPTHRSRQSDRDRYEVCCHRYAALADGGAGLAVLNDGKYGVSTPENEIRLTLLRASMMPDMYADQGMQEFTYSVFPFSGPFVQSDVVRQAAELNEPVTFGTAFEADSSPILLPLDKNILVDTVKPADTVPGVILVRVYEAMGMATQARFAVGARIGKLEETDMLEEHRRALPLDGTLSVPFGAFEIKTFLLYPQ